MKTHRSVVISGGGPTGLAAALLFAQLGWDEIVLAERRPSPQDFEKNKSFNYLIEARGQAMLRRLDLVDRLDDCGVATRAFTATIFGADGTNETRTFPIIDPDRPTCYWTTRRAFLTMLYDALEERMNSRLHVLYDHDLVKIRGGENEPVEVDLADGEGRVTTFRPDLLLACDGLFSTVRREVSGLAQTPEDHFAMVAENSLSTGLRYKVLNLPSRFQTRNGAAASDYRMSYIIPSRHKDRRKGCALFAFPVVNPSHPRSVNLIRESDHELWTLRTGEELLAFLADSFPQIDVHSLVSRDEAEDFVALEAGTFPAPQYSRNAHIELGPPDQPTQVLLLGDAAHAFPPDLGLGVNAALQDLTVLAAEFDKGGQLAEVARTYAERRLPESRDLVWMARVAFAEQYNHRPWRLKVWALRFVVIRILHSLAPRLFDKPAYYLSQEPEMSYGEMRLRTERTERRVHVLGMATLVVAAAFVIWLIY